MSFLVVVACSEENTGSGSAGGTVTGGAGSAGADGTSGSGGMDAGSLGDAGGGGATNIADAEGGGASGMSSPDGDGDDQRALDPSEFSWRTLPSLAKKRQNAIGAAVDQTMYVIGGLVEGGPIADVERLDLGQSAWTVAPSLPNPQCCAAAGVLGTVIAVAGGYEPDGHTPTNALVLFDTTTGTWQSGPPMPSARANAMGAVWNGRLAVIGGGTGSGATQASGVVEIYDPASNSWATSTLAVTPRAAGVAVVDSDRIYVIGGAVQNSLYGGPLVEIVTASGVTAGPSLSLGRAQVVGGLLTSGPAIAGGWTAAGDTATSEGLLGAHAVWESFPPMPTSRAGAAAAVINGSLIVAGGAQFQGTWVRQDVVEALHRN